MLITTLSRRLELSWSQGEISQRTLAGQIYLTLNEEKITQAFKKFWLDGKVIKEMDYPIFMAVNQKPVKDNSGNYRYFYEASLSGEDFMIKFYLETNSLADNGYPQGENTVTP